MIVIEFWACVNRLVILLDPIFFSVFVYFHVSCQLPGIVHDDIWRARIERQQQRYDILYFSVRSLLNWIAYDWWIRLTVGEVALSEKQKYNVDIFISVLLCCISVLVQQGWWTSLRDSDVSITALAFRVVLPKQRRSSSYIFSLR